MCLETRKAGEDLTGLVAVCLPVPVDDDRWLIGRREGLTPDAVRALGLLAELIVGLDDLRRLLDDEGLRPAPERRLEDLVHRVHEDELHRLADLVRDVAKVLLVLPRKDDH